MITVITHEDGSKLPSASQDVIPVQIYKNDKFRIDGTSLIANSVKRNLELIKTRINQPAFDFLTFALSVTAADTFIPRHYSPNKWTRHIHLVTHVRNVEIFNQNKAILEEALNFLSGDFWQLEFRDKGPISPKPNLRKRYSSFLDLKDLDIVCLFSGGLDSAIGVIDLLNNNKNILLVSHAYRGDKAYQDRLRKSFKGTHSQLSINADPRHFEDNTKTDITMRTRSLNFIALGIIGADIVSKKNGMNAIDLVVPENGFISINAPLTKRRIGSLSTRTTHPFFFKKIQEFTGKLFEDVKFNFYNPYMALTKGEMIKNCGDQTTLKTIVEITVSCSNWKRKNMQCGRCLPCIVRKSAIYSSGMIDKTPYVANNLNKVLARMDKHDDLISIISAIKRLPSTSISKWVSQSGPLPLNQTLRDLHKDVFKRGLEEIQNYLVHEGVI